MNQLQAQFHFQVIRITDYLRRPETLHMAMIIGIGMVLGVFGSDVYAAGGSMPWEEPICAVAKSLATTTAKAVAVMAVVFCGLMLAFGELGGVFKTFIGLLMGVSMAIMAGQWVGFIDGSGGQFCGNF